MFNIYNFIREFRKVRDTQLMAMVTIIALLLVGYSLFLLHYSSN